MTVCPIQFIIMILSQFGKKKALIVQIDKFTKYEKQRNGLNIKKFNSYSTVLTQQHLYLKVVGQFLYKTFLCHRLIYITGYKRLQKRKQTYYIHGSSNKNINI